MRRIRSDDGSTLPLIAGFGALALALILVVTAASSLYLERKRLFTLADGAALVGAESFDIRSVRLGPDGALPELRPAEVRFAVGDYLAATSPSEFEGLTIERATTPDGRGATVTLSSIWRPPVVTVFFPDGIRIEVTSSARSVFD